MWDCVGFFHRQLCFPRDLGDKVDGFPNRKRLEISSRCFCHCFFCFRFFKEIWKVEFETVFPDSSEALKKICQAKSFVQVKRAADS